MKESARSNNPRLGGISLIDGDDDSTSFPYFQGTRVDRQISNLGVRRKKSISPGVLFRLAEKLKELAHNTSPNVAESTTDHGTETTAPVLGPSPPGHH